MKKRLDKLIQLFLRGKTFRYEEQELLNILLKGINSTLINKKELDRTISIKKDGDYDGKAFCV